MSNSNHCKDLHAIKLVDDIVHRDERTHVTNPHDWGKDNTAFYKPIDDFYYMKDIDINGGTFSVSWKLEQPDNHRSENIIASVSPRINKRSFILWIDRKDNDSSRIEQQLTHDRDVKIEFRETYSHAEEYLLTNRQKISKQTSNFLIICRGFYRDENKNPIDLLQLLDWHGLGCVPVIVFTQNKLGLMVHLEKQALPMRISNWQERLFITDRFDELIKEAKQKTGHYAANHY